MLQLPINHKRIRLPLGQHLLICGLMLQQSRHLLKLKWSLGLFGHPLRYQILLKHLNSGFIIVVLIRVAGILVGVIVLDGVTNASPLVHHPIHLIEVHLQILDGLRRSLLLKRLDLGIELTAVYFLFLLGGGARILKIPQGRNVLILNIQNLLSIGKLRIHICCDFRITSVVKRAASPKNLLFQSDHLGILNIDVEQFRIINYLVNVRVQG